MEGSKRRVASGSGTAPLVVPAAPKNLPAGQPMGGAGDAGPIPPATGSSNTGFNANTSAPLSTQLRDLLDTTSLADIRRLEASGAAAASPQALERAAAALRARADWLDAQSRSMRAKAQAK
jgi:hypothetical protein